MAGRSTRAPRGVVGAAVLVASCGMLAGALLGAMLWSVLSPVQRDAVVDALADQLATIVAMAVLLVVGVGVLVAHLLGRYVRALRRLAADVELLETDPDHHLAGTGPPEVREVAERVEALAARRRVAEREMETQVAAAAARVTQERNRLAGLMSELAVAVVVCNADGRILLYNSAARSLVGDETALGIGRPVEGVVDPGLLAHARDRIAGGAAYAAATGGAGGRVLEVRVAPVPGPPGQPPGLVLLLEDRTDGVPGERAAVSGTELARLVAAELGRAGDLRADPGPPPDDQVWAHADTHALTRGLADLATRAAGHAGAGTVRVTAAAAGDRLRLALTWDGPPADPADVHAWAAEPVAGGTVPPLAETLARHDASLQVEPRSVAVLLRPAEVGVPPAAEPPSPLPEGGSEAESRPEFYDFDLFGRRERPGDWTEVPLADLTFTVFDTETTGLLPTEGDEIVSIGAVRVLNGRVLRQESFERLVDPQRSVPEVSTAVHGLTREMLRGRPTIAAVLPEFARYAADTVLVGHNVGFDLQFLRLKEAATGVRLDQPVLDTLLLDAVVDPGEDRHSLEAIAARMGLRLVDRHSALGDALVTAEVLLRLLPRLRRRGIHTLGQALEATRATLQSRLDQRMYGA